MHPETREEEPESSQGCTIPPSTVGGVAGALSARIWFTPHVCLRSAPCRRLLCRVPSPTPGPLGGCRRTGSRQIPMGQAEGPRSLHRHPLSHGATPGTGGQEDTTGCWLQGTSGPSRQSHPASHLLINFLSMCTYPCASPIYTVSVVGKLSQQSRNPQLTHKP